MELTGASLGANLFWMISLGLFIGLAGYYIYGNDGINLAPSLVVSSAGSVMLGVMAFILKLAVPLAYSLIGAIGFLFLVNTFRQKEDAIFEESDIVKKGDT